MVGVNTEIETSALGGGVKVTNRGHAVKNLQSNPNDLADINDRQVLPACMTQGTATLLYHAPDYYGFHSHFIVYNAPKL